MSRNFGITRHASRDVTARPRTVGVMVGLIAVTAMAGFASTSSAVVTIGSNLGAEANAAYAAGSVYPAGAPLTAAQDVLPGAQTKSPFNGVVVRWRVKTDGAPPVAPFTLRVISPSGAGVVTGPQGTPATGTIVHTFDARLPIAAGQLIGVDLLPAPDATFAFYLNATPPPGSGLTGGAPGALVATWSPALPDGQARPADPDPDTELLLNADIEPDADGDAYGDESQDKCKADPFPAGGVCTAPQLQLGGRTSQRLSRSGISVAVACPTEPCTAAAKGTVAVPGAAKVFKLRPATKKLAAGAKAQLKLKFAARTFKAVKRALKKRKKIKAKIKITATDLGGKATSLKRTIKLKR